jgi:MFS family permease
MNQNSAMKNEVKKFLGIEVPPDLTRRNFFFLYFTTFFIGLLPGMPAIIQPAFLKKIINVSPEFFGSINGILQNTSQIATLAFVGLVGVLSDRVGRKILAILGFAIMFIFFYLYGMSNEIAAALKIPADITSKICATLCFASARANEFIDFAPGLFVAYIIRLIIGIGLVFCFPQFIVMVADYTYAKDRGKGMAFSGAVKAIAGLVVFIVFAPIGRAFGVEELFSTSSIIAFLGAVCTWAFLKDRLHKEKSGKDLRKGIKEIFRVVNKSLPIKASYLCAVITRPDIGVMAVFLISWSVKVADKYQMTAEAATFKGSISLIVLLTISFIIMPVIGILLDRWGRVPTLILSLICGGVGLVLIALSPDPFSKSIFIAVALLGLGMAGYQAGTYTLVSDASPKGMVGSILGGLNTLSPFGHLFFITLGGYLFDVFGPGWAFALKGAANILLAIWMFIIKKRIKIDPEEI